MTMRKRQQLLHHYHHQRNSNSKITSSLSLIIILHCLLFILVVQCKAEVDQTIHRDTQHPTTTSSSHHHNEDTPQNNQQHTRRNNNPYTQQQQRDVVQHIILNLSTTTADKTSSSSSSSPSWMNDEDATLLDVFGQVAKEVLTNQLIPPTDALCDWDWKHMRCEPYCQCSLHFQWGDYHLGRSCRKRTEQYKQHEEEQDQNNNNINNHSVNTEKDKNKNSFLFNGEDCRRPPNTIIVKGVDVCGRFVDLVGTKIQGLNYFVKNRVGLMKDDVCTSLKSSKGGSRRSDGNDGSDLDEQYNDRDDDSNDGDLIERPVRAIRRVLKCDIGNSKNHHHQEEKEEIDDSSSSPKVLHEEEEEEVEVEERQLHDEIPTDDTLSKITPQQEENLINHTEQISLQIDDNNDDNKGDTTTNSYPSIEAENDT